MNLDKNKMSVEQFYKLKKILHFKIRDICRNANVSISTFYHYVWRYGVIHRDVVKYLKDNYEELK